MRVTMSPFAWLILLWIWGVIELGAWIYRAPDEPEPGAWG
jgi:hypothetical protein